MKVVHGIGRVRCMVRYMVRYMELSIVFVLVASGLLVALVIMLYLSKFSSNYIFFKRMKARGLREHE